MNPNRLVNGLVRLGGQALRTWLREKRSSSKTPGRPKASIHVKDSTSAGYPGDYTQRPVIEYEANNDNEPDPGEIVWTWVPFEEDHSQGKDRPVLVIGHDGPWLLTLQVSTVDPDDPGHHEREAKFGRYWITIGSGNWDSRHRDSEVRVNRIIRIDPEQVRRIGASLDPQRYDMVTKKVLEHY